MQILCVIMMNKVNNGPNKYFKDRGENKAGVERRTYRFPNFKNNSWAFLWQEDTEFVKLFIAFYQ